MQSQSMSQGVSEFTEGVWIWGQIGNCRLLGQIGCCWRSLSGGGLGTALLVWLRHVGVGSKFLPQGMETGLVSCGADHLPLHPVCAVQVSVSEATENMGGSEGVV